MLCIPILVMHGEPADVLSVIYAKYSLYWSRRGQAPHSFLVTSVADPNPDPDPHVFGPPGSGSTGHRYGSGSGYWSGSGSGSFYHQAKIVRKTLIPTFLLLFLIFYLDDLKMM
jgi:hypothetical protein